MILTRSWTVRPLSLFVIHIELDRQYLTIISTRTIICTHEPIYTTTHYHIPTPKPTSNIQLHLITSPGENKGRLSKLHCSSTFHTKLEQNTFIIDFYTMTRLTLHIYIPHNRNSIISTTPWKQTNQPIRTEYIIITHYNIYQAYIRFLNNKVKPVHINRSTFVRYC